MPTLVTETDVTYLILTYDNRVVQFLQSTKMTLTLDNVTDVTKGSYYGDCTG